MKDKLVPQPPYKINKSKSRQTKNSPDTTETSLVPGLLFHRLKAPDTRFSLA